MMVRMGVLDRVRKWMTRAHDAKTATLVLGASGERAAELHLKSRGMKIIARNYRCPAGELDLIVADRGTIVFVEVKALASDEDADPVNKINPVKQRKLESVARYWLRTHGEPQAAYRFDAISVIMRDGQPEVRQIEEAFIPKR